MKQPIFSIAELWPNMKVEVTDKRTSKTQEGVVTKVNYIKKCRTIDGRPIRTSRVSEVIITLGNCEHCKLNLENFRYYQVKMLE